MTGPIRLALALLPLAGYFGLLGTWHAGSRPKVVPGPRDFAFLSMGLGGLLAFGPVGAAIVRFVFPQSSLPAWLAVASLTGLLAMVGAARARHRLVIYHINADDLPPALGRALERIGGPMTRTLKGYESADRRRGVTVEFGQRLDYAVVEVYGDHPEELAESLGPALATCLQPMPSRPPTRLSAIWYALSCATLGILCLGTAILTRPEARALMRRISGG